MRRHPCHFAELLNPSLRDCSRVRPTVEATEEFGAGIVSIGPYEGNLIGWVAEHSSISNKHESAASGSDSDNGSSDVEGGGQPCAERQENHLLVVEGALI